MDALTRSLLAGLSAQSVRITYRRGGSTVSLKAVVGRTNHETYGPEGELLSSRSTDWVFRTADLRLAGSPTLPQVGDEIVANGRTYLVRPVGGDRSYRFPDPFRTLLRVYTVEK